MVKNDDTAIMLGVQVSYTLVILNYNILKYYFFRIILVYISI